MKYLKVPKKITFDEIKKNKQLSASNYKKFLIKNSNVKKLKNLIKIDKLEKGKEVGSDSYINKSKFFFIRTRSFKKNYILPQLKNSECIVPILPESFKEMNLKNGDIIVCKDSNVGEVAYLNKDLKNYMLCGGIYKIRITKEIRYYVLGFLKNCFFKEQIFSMTSKGSTIRHAKKLWLNANIPFPFGDTREEIIKFVSLLTKAIIKREEEIVRKFNVILNLIHKELKNNQKDKKFDYSKPRINNLQSCYRLDAGFYCKELAKEQFLIENYKYGYTHFKENDYELKRGQNLQVSQIGESIYSNCDHENYYKLIRPTNLSDNGTVENFEYLGNPKQLKTINEGEIIFSAEGNIGKFCVFIDVDNRTITNIHGITIKPKKKKYYKNNIFLGCFLGYLKERGVLDYLSVGGQGGSLAQQYWKYIKIPKFSDEKIEEIEKYYFNTIESEKNISLTDFELIDNKIIANSGIKQLEKHRKKIIDCLDEVVNKIANGEKLDIDKNLKKLN